MNIIILCCMCSVGGRNCAVMNNKYLQSDKKFESGSGWPSFTDVVEKGNVHRIVDTSLGMVKEDGKFHCVVYMTLFSLATNRECQSLVGG